MGRKSNSYPIPIKGRGWRKQRVPRLPRSKVKRRRHYKDVRIPRLRKIPRYGCQLGRVRLDFHRSGRHHMSAERMATLLGITLERYLALERGYYKREPSASELVLMLRDINKIRASYGLAPITVFDLWKIPD